MRTGMGWTFRECSVYLFLVLKKKRKLTAVCVVAFYERESKEDTKIRYEVLNN